MDVSGVEIDLTCVENSAERFPWNGPAGGHPPETALTLGRAVAGAAARVKARNICRKERRTDRDADTPGLAVPHVTAPVLLLGKTSCSATTAAHSVSTGARLTSIAMAKRSR
jgi:hypothetical protein